MKEAMWRIDPSSGTSFAYSVDPDQLTMFDAGRQPGDPSLAGQAILAVLGTENPPVHLLLGTDALNAVTATQQARTTEMDEWRFLSVSTDRAANSAP
jgi:hypothetical protein